MPPCIWPADPSTAKTSPDSHEHAPLRRTDIAAGKLVLRKRGPGGALLPNKQRVNIFLDGAVIEHFKAKAGERGYQTLINEALKRAIQADTIEGIVRVIALRSFCEGVHAAGAGPAQRVQQVEACWRQLGKQRACRLEAQPVVGRAPSVRAGDLLCDGSEDRTLAAQFNDCLHGVLHSFTSRSKSTRSCSSVMKV